MLFDAAKYGKQRKTEIKNNKDKSDFGYRKTKVIRTDKKNNLNLKDILNIIVPVGRLELFYA